MSHADPPSPVPPSTVPPSKIAPSTITPLALLLAMMRERYDAKDFEAAITLAKVAAPYLHPRASTSTPATDLAAIHDADLEQLSPRD